jgi:hypothetical protein
VESSEVPASCRDTTRSSMQKLHLIRTTFGGDEDGLGRGNLCHLRCVEMSERSNVVNTLHVQSMRALGNISINFHVKSTSVIISLTCCAKC